MSNLHHANLSEVHVRTFKNASIDLGQYAHLLREVRNYLKQISALPIELNLVEPSIAFDNNHRYRIAPKNDRLEEIEQRLFEQEVREFYQHDKPQRREQRIKIIDRDGEAQEVVLKEDHGKSVTLYLREDDYQLKKQQEAVDTLRHRPLTEHAPLLKLFQDKRYQQLNQVDFSAHKVLNVPEDWNVLTDETRDGTSEQRDFVRRALATNDFALLEGPPGSGKTTTILELILQLCRLGKRVLLVSSTHVAVDNVLKRILPSSGRVYAQSGVVAPVRIASDEGQIRYDEVVPYRLQNLVRKKREDLLTFLETQPNRTPSQEQLLHSLREDGIEYLRDIILESSNLVCGTMIGILQHPFIRQNEGIGVPFDVMIVDEASKVPFTQFLVPALYAKRWILVGDVKQLSPYVEGEHLEIMLAREVAERDRDFILELYEMLRSARFGKQNQVRVLLSKQYNHKVAASILSDRDVVYLKTHQPPTNEDILRWNAAKFIVGRDTKSNRRWLTEYLFVRTQLHEIQVEKTTSFHRMQVYHANEKFHHRKDAQMEWAGELAQLLSQQYSFRSAPELGKHLDRNIELLTPSTLENLAPAVEKLRRLLMPSILELLQEGIKRPRSHDYLERILYDGFPDAAKRVKFVSLTYQHRMVDAIAQTSRDNFYADNLRTANTVEERDNPLTTFRPNETVIWISNNYRNRQHRRNGRRYNHNEPEADAIVSELRALLKWAQGSPRNEPFEVAVLCFYLDQVRMVRRKLQELYRQSGRQEKPTKNFRFERVHVVLCTVDKFQGDEADLVMLSFSKATWGAFYKSPNRLNVALTRARYKLQLYGDREFFRTRKVSKALTDLATHFPARRTSRRV